MQQFDRVTATFTPRRADDLQDGSAAFIGQTHLWQAAWVVEDGPYSGEWAMISDRPGPLGWVPSGDLTLPALT